MVTHYNINNVFFRLPFGINNSHDLILVASEKQSICQDIKWHNRWSVVLKQHNNWPNRWIFRRNFLQKTWGRIFLGGLGERSGFPKFLGGKFLCVFLVGRWILILRCWHNASMFVGFILTSHHLGVVPFHRFQRNTRSHGTNDIFAYLIDPIKMNHSCRWIYHSHGSVWFSDAYHIWHIYL